jgi:D-xylose transport system substrate-binding protein
MKDARILGKVAGEAAIALARGAALAEVQDTVEFESPGGNTMISIILDPTPVTRDNLDFVIDGGFLTQEDLCQGVSAGTVEICG